MTGIPFPIPRATHWHSNSMGYWKDLWQFHSIYPHARTSYHFYFTVLTFWHYNKSHVLVHIYQPTQQVFGSLLKDAWPVQLDPADDAGPAALGLLPRIHPLSPSDLLKSVLFRARCREESDFSTLCPECAFAHFRTSLTCGHASIPPRRTAKTQNFIRTAKKNCAPSPRSLRPHDEMHPINSFLARWCGCSGFVIVC